jgi:hypothetical protein
MCLRIVFDEKRDLCKRNVRKIEKSLDLPQGVTFIFESGGKRI